MSVVTHQQKFYESAYREAEAGVGFPDPKIANGQPLVNKRILTLGGGTANDLWHLTKQNSVINADYATSGLSVGEQFGVQGVRANLNLEASLPFSDHTFDLVVCKDILEHLLEPLLVLREAMRVLRDDGTMIISVPNHS